MTKVLQIQECSQRSLEPRDITHLTLPNYENLPAERAKQGEALQVAFSISTTLVPPELSVRPRIDKSMRAIVKMPKTTMDENDFPGSGEHKIRFAARSNGINQYYR